MRTTTAARPQWPPAPSPADRRVEPSWPACGRSGPVAMSLPERFDATTTVIETRHRRRRRFGRRARGAQRPDARSSGRLSGGDLRGRAHLAGQPGRAPADPPPGRCTARGVCPTALMGWPTSSSEAGSRWPRTRKTRSSQTCRSARSKTSRSAACSRPSISRPRSSIWSPRRLCPPCLIILMHSMHLTRRTTLRSVTACRSARRPARRRPTPAPSAAGRCGSAPRPASCCVFAVTSATPTPRRSWPPSRDKTSPGHDPLAQLPAQPADPARARAGRRAALARR